MSDRRFWYEFTEFETADGETFVFDTPTRFVIGESGYGLPEVELISQRGVFQHGVTVYDYRLAPRTIQLVIRENTCSREQYWTIRDRLMDMIRPNRHAFGVFGMGKLIKTRTDGSKRAIDVIIQKGPSFEKSQNRKWDEWSYSESLLFYAPDPTFYDPDIVTVNWNMSPDTSAYLSFPFTFDGTNMRFRRSYFERTETITYDGTWIAFPSFTIVGPVSIPAIVNSSTNQTIRLYKDIASGETVTISLEAANKIVESDIYGNIIGCVEDTNDLTLFHLGSDPEITGGTNLITFSGNKTDGNTAFTMQYYTRYIGA